MPGKKRSHSGEPLARRRQSGSANATPLTNEPPKLPPPPGREADKHFRELYATDLDFRQLGRWDLDFDKLLRQGSIDFTDPEAVMQLTKTLLKLDFGLDIDLPKDRLCPPVPNRHNYILWLKDLMDSSSYDEPGRTLSGLDIGTGASCIYPLLGSSQRDWYFVGTDIDSKSLAFAKRNVQLNNLGSRIRILDRQPTDNLIPLDDLGVESINFVMMNPPFYLSEEDMLVSARGKARPPFSACTGATVEMVTDGGEVGFVGRLLKESLLLRDRVQWYTSMLGKQSSLETLLAMIRDRDINNYAVTEFVQGNKTRRWAIAWSFGAMRPSNAACRGINASATWRRLMPPIVEMDVFTMEIGSIGKMADRASELLGSLHLAYWAWDREKLNGVGRAKENVWGRAWRRKKAKKGRGEAGGEQTGEKNSGATERGGEVPDEDEEQEEAALGFEISILARRVDVALICQWREGRHPALFESFVGFLRSRLRPGSTAQIQSLVL